jgi:predicted ATP-grasp superfamily ATP-dependent carboligase
MEFKKDARDGIYKLMEVNPRHNRSTLLAVRCGINFPLMEYMHLAHDLLESPKTYRQGVYWIDCARDLVASRRYRRAGKFSLTSYIKPYVKSHTFATLSMTDLRPCLKRCIDILKMAVKMIFTPKKSDRVSQHVPIHDSGREFEKSPEGGPNSQQSREEQKVLAHTSMGNK